MSCYFVEVFEIFASLFGCHSLSRILFLNVMMLILFLLLHECDDVNALYCNMNGVSLLFICLLNLQLLRLRVSAVGGRLAGVLDPTNVYEYMLAFWCLFGDHGLR